MHRIYIAVASAFLHQAVIAQLLLWLAWPNVSSAQVRTVALAGMQAPGTPAGIMFSDFSHHSINSLGQTAFNASLLGEGVNVSNGYGVWSEGSHTLHLVARAGDQAPGTPVGVSFLSQTNATINAVGEAAFIGFLTVSSVDVNDEGVWSERSGVLSLVARTGDQAPSAPQGVTFHRFYLGDLALSYSSAGHTAFQANVVGTLVDASNDWGIWSEHAGVLHPTAREGEQAPGTSIGVVFSGLDDVSYNKPVVNSAGHVAFSAQLAGAGVDAANDSGIWFGHPGALELAARDGNQAPGAAAGVRFNGFFPPAINSTVGSHRR